MKWIALSQVDALRSHSHFVVEHGQSNGEGLEYGQWIGTVEVVNVVVCLSELQVNLLFIAFIVVQVNQLEVLGARGLDPTIEVEDVRLNLLVPLGLFVLHVNQILLGPQLSPLFEDLVNAEQSLFVLF